MKTLTHRITTLSTAVVLAFSSFLSFLSSASTYAEIEPGSRTTASATTFAKTESTTEKVARDVDRSNYINEKKQEWLNTETGQGVNETYRNAWLALYVSDTASDTYKYPAYVGTYFTGVSVADECGGSGNAILIGDVDEIIGGMADGCVTYNYEVRYQEVNVELASLDDYAVIDEINLTVNLPKAGTAITMEDDDIDTQVPQADITLPDGAQFYLWGDEYMNYAYWLQSDYEPFTGVLEKGGKYYIELFLHINQGALARFASNPTLLINGVETPYEITEGYEDGRAIGFWFEVTIDDEEEPAEEEPASAVSAPDSGAFTSSSSATSANSGIAVATLIGLAYIFFKKSSTRR